MNLTPPVFWGMLLPILQQHEQGTLSLPERQKAVNGDSDLCSQVCGCAECEGDWPVGNPFGLFTLRAPEDFNLDALTAPCGVWEFVFLEIANSDDLQCDELSAGLDMLIRLDPEFRRTCRCPALRGEEEVCTLPGLICGVLDFFDFFLDFFHLIMDFLLGLWPF